MASLYRIESFEIFGKCFSGMFCARNETFFFVNRCIDIFELTARFGRRLLIFFDIFFGNCLTIGNGGFTATKPFVVTLLAQRFAAAQCGNGFFLFAGDDCEHFGSTLTIGFEFVGIGEAIECFFDFIERQDAALKKNVESIRALRSLGSSLVAQCSDEEAKKELKKLSDTLNYCDPVSNDATAEAETELNALLQEIQRAIVDGDNESISPLCRKASAVLAERNRLCKLNK